MKALVFEFGTKNWNEIASHFTHKSGRQCHERWKQMGAIVETPKKSGPYIGNFDFTKAIAVIKKNVAGDTAYKTTPTMPRSHHATTPVPGILGKASALSQASGSLSLSYSASPRIGKVSKLNNIANKLKIRQELNSAEKSVANRFASPPQKRKLDQWSRMYGVDVEQIECVSVIKRPPPPPAGFLPRRILPQNKRQRINDASRPVHESPWMSWTSETLEHSLMSMIEWKYPTYSTKQQLAAINSMVARKTQAA
ncbi:Aste57867_8391 [Aphanomyces stellatus]|uniref:Aste57867_8391 protein n=1 Tax=Aphanomyces stellatus TaxID=120398 RepID=A0A485KK95_9STRA|nr:hypothetical protein As57867_008359 [Aphanomyces stellatus]VFT85277.1 Aste57867_8391 [Aphanomyces stellatus]